MGTVATGAFDLTKPEKLAPASTFISQVDYDPQNNTMDVTFHSGTRIRYLRVFPVTYLSLKSSPTFDSYYSRAIKGNLTAIKLVDSGIGRKESSPLQTVKKERTLDSGHKHNQRIAGTVARAFAGNASPSPSDK